MRINMLENVSVCAKMQNRQTETTHGKWKKNHYHKYFSGDKIKKRGKIVKHIQWYSSRLIGSTILPDREK